MAEVTLLPGDVFTIVGSGVDIPPVGTPPQWADGSDDTYAVAALDSISGVNPRAYLDAYAFSEPPTTVVYHARASTTSVNPEPFAFGMTSDDFSVFMTGPSQILQAQADATPTWYVSAPITIPDPAAFAVASAAGTIRLFSSQQGHDPTGDDTRTTIYEAHVVVTVGTVEPPPVAEPATRQFPRDDALGLGSAPRLYPPPRSGRVVGGHM